MIRCSLLLCTWSVVGAAALKNCTCQFCPGYGQGTAVDSTICPQRSLCPQRAPEEFAWWARIMAYCYGQGVSGPKSKKKKETTDGICNCKTGHFLSVSEAELVDPDTPPEARIPAFSRTGKRAYNLTFSDEFNAPHRLFQDGFDPKWTALNKPPTSTDQVNHYRPERAYTEDGKLKVTAALQELAGRPYATAMLQTWNKFCFSGGVVDMKVKMPGSSGEESKGLWPAFWLMGNLGRATYISSTEHIWPFSPGDVCPAPEHHESNSIAFQHLSACTAHERNVTAGWKPGYNRARGCAEIDIYEVRLGTGDERWENRVIDGYCDQVSEGAFNDVLVVKEPFMSTSLQIAPGIPVSSRMRPERLSASGAGCLWPRSDYMWYDELFPGGVAYPSWPSDPCAGENGSQCPTMPNIDFYGTTFSGFQTDGWSGNTYIPPKAFQADGVDVRLEWNINASVPSGDGSADSEVFLAWYLDNMTTPVYQLRTSMLASKHRPQENWKLEERRVPDEPMYLLLNLDLSSTWGWPVCHLSNGEPCDKECRQCVDCRDPKCLACGDEVRRLFLQSLCKFLGRGDVAMEVDYVRVYSDLASCEPPHAPTKQYIGDNADRYYESDKSKTDGGYFNASEPGSQYPLTCTRAGGGSCDPSEPDSCGGAGHGSCIQRSCVCSFDAQTGQGWTGPNCLTQASGPSRWCPYFFEHDSEAVNSRMFLPDDSCVAPLPQDSPGVTKGFFTPTTGNVIEIAERNCLRVRKFQQHVHTSGWMYPEDVVQRVNDAAGLCGLIMYDGILGECCPEYRANVSLKAWGEIIMGGQECCNLSGYPFCSMRQSLASYCFHLAPFVLSCCFLLFVWLSPYCVGNVRGGGVFIHRQRRQEVTPARCASTAGEVEQAGQASKAEILDVLRSSFVASEFSEQEFQAWAAEISSTFTRLAHLIGFQHDSVLNQLEVFLSLWRSQVTALRDADTACEELLPQGLDKLHEKLLHGFKRWRLANNLEAQDTQKGASRPRLARLLDHRADEQGANGYHSSCCSDAQKACMVECVAFLLVWGEASNLRFCPELVCFLVDAVCEDAESAAVGNADADERRAPGDFLRILRPMYHAMFDETYESVAVNPSNKAEKTKPLLDCVAFAPPSAANYDDWNELFKDLHALQSKLSEAGATPSLTSSDGSSRMKALQSIDWFAAFHGTKTFREIHSFMPLFVAVDRIVLLHTLLFVAAAFIAVEGGRAGHSSFPNGVPIMGSEWAVRVAAMGLITPCHLLVKAIALHAISQKPLEHLPMKLARLAIFLLLPIATYTAVRLLDSSGGNEWLTSAALSAHFAVSLLALVWAMFPQVSDGCEDVQHAGPATVFGRAFFWVLVFGLKFYFACNVTLLSTSGLVQGLNANILSHSAEIFVSDIFSPGFDKDILLWFLVWSASYVCFFADTFLWVMIGYCFLGLLVAFHQRSWALYKLLWTDQVAHVPENFKRRVLEQSGAFEQIWDRICDEMKAEDKISAAEAQRLKYGVHEDQQGQLHWNEPWLFHGTPMLTRFLGRPQSFDVNWPRNPDAQWRLAAFTRGLSLNMPRPYKGRNIPGLTVLIPHYGEVIMQDWNNLCRIAADDHDHREVQLLKWLMLRYPDEWEKLCERSQALQSQGVAAEAESITDPESQKDIERWASFRTQTLYRTVSGMCQYDKALRLLAEVSDGNAGTRTPKECFRCLLAMQRYAVMDEKQLGHVEDMLAELPDCVAIAFIDFEDGPRALLDSLGIHPRQERRYFASLVDGSCGFAPGTRRRVPKYRVELPGFPVLGNGKGDNQNCAIIYSRGEFVQAIDANQGGYLEQALLMPNLLAEFRKDPKLIVGTPEHIISDFGTIGDFAASSEMVFGSLVQRTMACLGGRMHYGHPDVMNNIFMMHQGGISKATKTIHLSEDIFAGMDFVLRGGRIEHREYFHVAKGRDLGFNSVLSFYSKLSAGTGEQVLTRQWSRICRGVGLERLFPIYYNHAGFYLSQFMFSFTVKMLMFVLVTLVLDTSDEGAEWLNRRYPSRGRDSDLLQKWDELSGASLVGEWISGLFGPLFLLFVAFSVAPLLLELWLQEGILSGVTRILKQQFTLGPLYYIFQGKVISEYIIHEIRYGGAQYIATGRELPTHRKAFVGPDLQGKPGLFEDFAALAHYDGAKLFFVAIGIGPFLDSSKLVYWWICSGLVIFSWLWAPYIYNPYQFTGSFIRTDWENWKRFFLGDRSSLWQKWVDSSLREGQGLRSNITEALGWMIYWYSFYMQLNLKLHDTNLLIGMVDPCFGCRPLNIFGNERHVSAVLAIMPPLGALLVGPLLASLRRARGQEPSPVLCAALLSSVLCAEVLVCICGFIKRSAWASMVNVILYKAASIEVFMFLARCWLRLRPRRWESLKLWLSGACLLRDVIVSLTILTPLTLLAGLINILPANPIVHRQDGGCHNLFVFRAWGDYRRRMGRAERTNVSEISLPEQASLP